LQDAFASLHFRNLSWKLNCFWNRTDCQSG